MSLGADAVLVQESLSSVGFATDYYPRPSLATYAERSLPVERQIELPKARPTPRKSLIVVLPENHGIASDAVCAQLEAEPDPTQVDVILACAGQSTSIGALQRKVRDLQILLAPAGTTPEDLRELAMNQAPGDIVTLLNGTPVV